MTGENNMKRLGDDEGSVRVQHFVCTTTINCDAHVYVFWRTIGGTLHSKGHIPKNSPPPQKKKK